MLYQFGTFLIDTDRFELKSDDTAISLEPKNFQLLRFLIENRDRVVSKDEIFESVWPGVFVSDASLSTAVSQIRKALGDDGQAQQFIRTVRGQGVHFVGDVQDSTAQRRAAVIGDKPAEQNTAPVSENRPTIAVLPFTLLATSDAHQAIAEAIPGELIATLSRLRWIKVIARGSTFQFGGKNADFDSIHAKLGATYVLSGSVELYDLRLAVVVELTDTRSHELVWSEAYSGKLDEVFALREDIARSVANILELRLPLHEADRLRLLPSENLDAWGHFHLGVRHMYQYDRADNVIAEGHFKQALALDPKFSRAHAGLSYTEFQNYFQMFGQELDHHRALALKHAENAVALDPLDPFGNLIMARAKWLFGEAEDSLQWTDRSIQMNPNYALAFYNSSIFNTVMCSGDIAGDNVNTAIGLSPLDPHMQSMLGIKALAAFVRDDMVTAHANAEQALHAPNSHLYVYMIAAVVYSRHGDLEKAQSCLDKIRAKNVPFGKDQFLHHYNLREPAKKAELVQSLERLGL